MSGRKLSREHSAKVTALLKFLTAKPESYEFLRPVDHRRLGLVDYLTIVKQPMDISTIKRKLKNGAYNDFDEVVADVMLIWANCKLYNPEHLLVHKQAIAMEAHTNEFLLKAQTELPKKRPRDEASAELKTELVQALKNLCEEEIGQVAELIYSLCPRAVTRLQEDHVQITLDKLDHASFKRVLQ